MIDHGLDEQRDDPAQHPDDETRERRARRLPGLSRQEFEDGRRPRHLQAFASDDSRNGTRRRLGNLHSIPGSPSGKGPVGSGSIGLGSDGGASGGIGAWGAGFLVGAMNAPLLSRIPEVEPFIAKAL